MVVPKSEGAVGLIKALGPILQGEFALLTTKRGTKATKFLEGAYVRSTA